MTRDASPQPAHVKKRLKELTRQLDQLCPTEGGVIVYDDKTVKANRVAALRLAIRFLAKGTTTRIPNRDILEVKKYYHHPLNPSLSERMPTEGDISVMRPLEIGALVVILLVLLGLLGLAGVGVVGLIRLIF